MGFVFGGYYRVDSVMHRLDPRIKINLMFLNIITCMLANRFVSLFIMTLLMILAWRLARIPLAIVVKSMFPVVYLTAMTVFFNFFFVAQGNELLSIGFILVTDRGIYLGLYMGLRLALMFAGSVLMTLTTTSLAMTNALSYMLRPFERIGFPAYEITLMMRMALSFMAGITTSMSDIRKAQAARGAVFDQGGPIRRVRALIPCLVPLFAQCFRDSENLALAIESRCYHGSGEHSQYRTYKIRAADLMALAVMLAASAGTIALRF